MTVILTAEIIRETHKALLTPSARNSIFYTCSKVDCANPKCNQIAPYCQHYKNLKICDKSSTSWMNWRNIHHSELGGCILHSETNTTHLESNVSPTNWHFWVDDFPLKFGGIWIRSLEATVFFGPTNQPLFVQPSNSDIRVISSLKKIVNSSYICCKKQDGTHIPRQKIWLSVFFRGDLGP